MAVWAEASSPGGRAAKQTTNFQVPCVMKLPVYLVHCFLKVLTAAQVSGPLGKMKWAFLKVSRKACL